MGFFDSLSPDVQNAAIRALIGAGSSMLINKDRGFGPALGMGLNTALGQFDQGMSISRRQKQQEEYRDYQERALKQREDLQTQRMIYDSMQTLRQQDFTREQNALVSPADQSAIDYRNAQTDLLKQQIKAANEQQKMMQEMFAGEKAKADAEKEQENAPGIFDYIESFLGRNTAATQPVDSPVDSPVYTGGGGFNIPGAQEQPQASAPQQSFDFRSLLGGGSLNIPQAPGAATTGSNVDIAYNQIVQGQPVSVPLTEDEKKQITQRLIQNNIQLQQ